MNRKPSEERSIVDLVNAIQHTYGTRRQLENEENDLREYLSFELLESVEQAFAIHKGIIKDAGKAHRRMGLLCERPEHITLGVLWCRGGDAHCVVEGQELFDLKAWAPVVDAFKWCNLHRPAVLVYGERVSSTAGTKSK